ncbi:hypothetical protein GP486_007418 [Trichoglossum hirsutum]|uniref:Up-regulated during septation protein 1 domain-containing protein n=1 Tax=Trichoglossum hirsutum TaxID=265104 RepID=A0A9P8L7L9_9PEZI|nr:hypothetical protein GP486_007418 [Trichoglossum hirsutum]
MAHIAECMRTGTAQDTSPSSQHGDSTVGSTAIGLGNAQRISDRSSQLPRDSGSSCVSSHLTEGQRYHLYPSSGRITPSSGRSTPDSAVRSASSLGMRTSASLCDLSSYHQAATSRVKLKDARGGRRKISVPEIGLMTTVQEAPMDSHLSKPKIENASPAVLPLSGQASALHPPALRTPIVRKRSASPMGLAPLVIPTGERACPGKSPLNNLLDDDQPPEVPPKSPQKSSPNRKASSPPMHGGPTSAPQVSSTTSTTTTTPSTASTVPSPATEIETSTGPLATILRCVSPAGGRSRTPTRDVESPTAFLDRGRSIRRTGGKSEAKDKRSRSGKMSPAHYRAFEHLPKGYRAEDAVQKLSNSQITLLERQAVEQAERFEILTHKDVERLSKELRALNERCEYLRKTFNSLRSGRRSLHNRMISYLRNPRLAHFSRESILKQQEALTELDASIDDWVDKLSHAENRRTRVQQKLLEHLAATMSLKRVPEPPGEHTPPRSPQKADCQSPERTDRSDAESIKIYADFNVYSLFADVEQEISRMVNFYESSNCTKPS